MLSAPLHNLKSVFINEAYTLRDTFFPEHVAFICAVKMLYKVLNTTPDDSTRVIFMYGLRKFLWSPSRRIIIIKRIEA